MSEKRSFFLLHNSAPRANFLKKLPHTRFYKTQVKQIPLDNQQNPCYAQSYFIVNLLNIIMQEGATLNSIAHTWFKDIKITCEDPEKTTITSINPIGDLSNKRILKQTVTQYSGTAKDKTAQIICSFPDFKEKVEAIFTPQLHRDDAGNPGRIVRHPSNETLPSYPVDQEQPTWFKDIIMKCKDPEKTTTISIQPTGEEKDNAEQRVLKTTTTSYNDWRPASSTSEVVSFASVELQLQLLRQQDAPSHSQFQHTRVAQFTDPYFPYYQDAQRSQGATRLPSGKGSSKGDTGVTRLQGVPRDTGGTNATLTQGGKGSGKGNSMG